MAMTEQEEAAEPLLVSSSAARRLAGLYAAPGRALHQGMQGLTADIGGVSNQQHHHYDSCCWLPLAAFRRLHVVEGTAVLMTHGPRCIVAPVHLSNPGAQQQQPAALLSPLAAFNLCLPHHLIPLLAPAPVRPSMQVHIQPLQAAPPTATRVRVCKVARPRVGVLAAAVAAAAASTVPTQRQEAASAALHAHFTTAERYVSAGDVLAVPIQGADPAWDDIVLFKVTEAEPSTGSPALPLRVDPSTTQLVLAPGLANSAIPVGLTPAPWKPAALLLRHTWHQAASVFAPLLHPSAAHVDARAALLLVGPQGCGRATAAAAAAAALGLHYLTWSCHELRGGAPAKTAGALRALFDRSAAFSPCLLLLQHLEALGSAAAAWADQVVGEALAACLEEHCTPAARAAAVTRSSAAATPPPPGLVLVIGCATALADVSPHIGRAFTHQMEVGACSKEEVVAMLQNGLPGTEDAALQAAAAQMVGLLPADAAAVVRGARFGAVTSHISPELLRDAAAARVAAWDAVGQVVRRSGASCGCDGKDDTAGELLLQAQASAAVADAARLSSHLLAAQPSSGQPPGEPLDAALSAVRKRTAAEVGAPSVPDVRWEDIGGLEDAKRAILDTVELPLKHAELFAGGLRKRSGLLLYGPPGSGKTLLAKAVATQCAANFMSVKGPELINMYVGESERQVREVFARAARARPCVLFFDELDSLAPARGAAGDSGGVMDRVVSQLLAEIDGAQAATAGGGSGGGGGNIFLIGATNRPDLLDSALLRPGRLDRLVYVGIAPEPAHKRRVLDALTRRFKLAPDVDLGVVAAACPPQLTGADLYALCADAWMAAFKRRVGAAGEEDVAGAEVDDDEAEVDAPGDTAVTVRAGDFARALAALTPSLSLDELAKYDALRDRYESRVGALAH